MAMNADGRADAIYGATMANNPRAKDMSTDEQKALRAAIKNIFGQADLGYITANADILPASLQAPSTNCTVATATGPASGTTVPAGLTGLGKVS